MASKTLDRNPEKDLGFLDDSFQKKKQFDKEESSFEDSFHVEEKVIEKTKTSIIRILQDNPNGRTLRQLHEFLRIQNSQTPTTEHQIKEILETIAFSVSS